MYAPDSASKSYRSLIEVLSFSASDTSVANLILKNRFSIACLVKRLSNSFKMAVTAESCLIIPGNIHPCGAFYGRDADLRLRRIFTAAVLLKILNTHYIM